jgi:hypothetical protein
MNGPRPFTQADITSVFKAAKAAGYSSARVEIVLGNGNRMIAVAGKGATPEANEGSKNPWDEVSR